MNKQGMKRGRKIRHIRGAESMVQTVMGVDPNGNKLTTTIITTLG